MSPSSRSRVLIVDDDPQIVDLLTATLRFAGLEVATASATGYVSMVGLFGEPYQGSIVYPVTILPADPIDGLRWGMTATVTIDTSSASSGFEDA